MENLKLFNKVAISDKSINEILFANDLNQYFHAILNKKGVITEVSDNFLLQTGFLLKDIIGKKFKEFLNNSSIPLYLKVFNFLSPDCPFQTTELLLLKVNSESIAVEVSFTLFQVQGDGQVYVIIKNVDHVKNEFEYLVKQREYYRILAENTSYVQILMDKHMKCLYVSSSAKEISGFSAKDLINENLFRLIHPDDINLVWDEFVKGDLRRRRVIQFKIRHADGHSVFVECDCRNIFDDFGQVNCIVLNLRDLKAQKQYEKELIKARRDAETSGKLKDDFLKLISHELRTPLNAILGFSRILEKDNVEKVKDAYLKVIIENGEHLLGMIDNILDFTQLNASQYKKNNYSIELDSFFRQLTIEVKREQYLLNKADVELEAHWDIDENYPNISTDPDMLMKSFKNLFSNAFKFTRQGSVKYGCKPYGIKSYLFYVEDTGIGIPTDKQDVIFEKFSQMDQSSTREYGGMGIGLSVTKQMIECMGGEIWLKSEAGVGSSFYFTLPVE